MTTMTLTVTYDDGLTISFDSADFDSLTKRFQSLAEVSALATLNAAGLGAAIVPDSRQQGPAAADPWGQPPGAQRPAQTQREAPRQAAPPPQQDGNVVTVQTPNGLQVWTLNPGNAPWCGCGEPSALVHGTTKQGKPYNAYRCAKGAGADWRGKCDYNEWV